MDATTENISTGKHASRGAINDNDVLGIGQERTLSLNPTWQGEVQWVSPNSLSNHPKWAGLLGFETPADEEDLIANVRENKVIHPLIVTGPDCASGEDVILDGERRRQAALNAHVQLIPVIRRTGLTAEAEEEILVKSALAAAHIRKLKQSSLAALESRLYELRSRGRGFRTDRTSVGTNGGASHEDALRADPETHVAC